MNLILNNQTVEITIDDQKISLTSDDVVIERKVKEGVAAFRDKDIALALDTTITDDLFEEAIAREIVNKINLLRKEKNFNITDRIHVIFDSTPLLKKSYDKHKKYIDHEILATIVRFEKCEGSELDINGQKTTIEIMQEKK